MLTVIYATAIAYILAAVSGLIMRGYYITPLERLGADGGSPWVGLTVGFVLSVVMASVNIMAVHRKVVRSWR